jgi:glucose-1-phosphatase
MLESYKIMKPDIKNIIFDLGGVLIDLDINKTYLELEKLLDVKAEEIYPKYQSYFDEYEKGELITENFLWKLQNISKNVPESPELIKAWNAMILGWVEEKLKFLYEIKNNYNIYLLSNTNELHIHHVRKNLKKHQGIQNFETEFFKKAYYSHELNMRKPSTAIYEYVVKDSNLATEETLFIDDNLDNVIAAKSIGLFVHHHKTNASIDIKSIIEGL